MEPLRFLEPCSNFIHVFLRGRYTPSRFLLERMQRVDDTFKFSGVDQAIRRATMLIANFQHTGAAKALEHFDVWMLRALTRPVERNSDQFAYRQREFF